MKQCSGWIAEALLIFHWSSKFILENIKWPEKFSLAFKHAWSLFINSGIWRNSSEKYVLPLLLGYEVLCWLSWFFIRKQGHAAVFWSCWHFKASLVCPSWKQRNRRRSFAISLPFPRMHICVNYLLLSSPKRSNRVYSTQGGTYLPHSYSRYLINSKKNVNRNVLSFGMLFLITCSAVESSEAKRNPTACSYWLHITMKV